MTCPSHPNEGRLAIVTKRAVGCGGRVACERRTQAVAYGEIVWSRHPDAGVKLCGKSRRATVARKPGRRGEHAISRKTIARGRPECSVCTCMLVCVFSHSFAHETAGAARTRSSLLPLFSRGRNSLQTSGKPCREMANP